MKKKLLLFNVLIVLLFAVSSVSTAAIVPGIYSNDTLDVTDFDGLLTIKSLDGGAFGVGDVAYGASEGLYWSFEGRVKIAEYTENFINNGGGTATVDKVITRSGGTATIYGENFFGDAPGTEYTRNLDDTTTTVTISLNWDDTAWDPYAEAYTGWWVGVSLSGDVYHVSYFSFDGNQYKSTTSYNIYGEHADIYPQENYNYFPIAMTNVIYEFEAVPVPGSLWLLGSGLLGFARLRRKA